MVEKVKANFKNVIVVMNVGGMVDTSWFKDCKEIPAVLMAWQGGMEGGLAAADVVTGDVNPSGKLVDTYAATLEDYPSTENFHKSVYYVDYNEDIYVGYRYFETIPGAAEKVNYPFGFGLSYTSFETEVLGAEEKDGKIVIEFDSMTLTRSQYWVDIVLEKADGTPIDYYKEAVRFNVVSGIEDMGVARIEHTWKNC